MEKTNLWVLAIVSIVAIVAVFMIITSNIGSVSFVNANDNEPTGYAFNLPLSKPKPETIQFIAGGTRARITFMNKDNKEVNLPLAANKNAVLGEGSSEPTFWGDGAPETSGQNAELTSTYVKDKLYFDGDSCFSTRRNVTDCIGAKFLVVTANKKAHIMQITNIETTTNTTTITDLTYATSNEIRYTPNGVTEFNLAGARLRLTITNRYINFNHIDYSDNDLNTGGVIETKNGALITIINRDKTSSKSEGVLFSESGSLGKQNTRLLKNWHIYATYDDIKNDYIEWYFKQLMAGVNGPNDWQRESPQNQDILIFTTYKGTKITYDNRVHQFILIDYYR